MFVFRPRFRSLDLPQFLNFQILLYYTLKHSAMKMVLNTLMKLDAMKTIVFLVQKPNKHSQENVRLSDLLWN